MSISAPLMFWRFLHITEGWLRGSSSGEMRRGYFVEGLCEAYKGVVKGRIRGVL